MTKKTIKNKQKNSEDGSILHQRLLEGLFVFVFAVSVFVFLSLFSYRLSDGNAVNMGLNINKGGLVGAWLSRGLLLTFGYLAYVMPVGLCYWAFSLIRSPSNVKQSWDVLVLRFLGFLLFIVGLCGLASLEGVHLGQEMPFSAGGAIGLYTAIVLYQIFNFIGSFVLLSAFILLGLTLFSNISWLSFIELIGRNLTSGLLAIGKWVGQLWQRMSQAYQKPTSTSSKTIHHVELKKPTKNV